MDLLVKPELVQEISEAIKTLNLNLGINLESQSGATAVKWIAGYLITKQALIFLAQIAMYVFFGWLALKLGGWIVKTLSLWIKENTKVRIAKDKLRVREEILDRIDFERMQEALDAWYNKTMKKGKKK